MVRETAAANLQERLAENPYPGRGILQGRSPEGDWVQVYWIMGRSANSRNRVFVGENDEGGVDRSITMRVIFHALANYICDFVELAVFELE